MGSVTIAFDADNPGRWAFHCHNLYHMMTGMMTEVRYPSIIRAKPSACGRDPQPMSVVRSILIRTGQQIAGPGLLARLRHLCTIGDIMETLMCKCFE